MFTHLHVHTEFSMLDGLSRLSPLVNRAKELGMDSLAITDHGGMYGAIDFYRLAKDAGVKPIIGCEMYVAPGSRFAKNPNDKSPYHMTVLAQDARGYQNLVKLVTRSHIEGFYYKPRIDRELLEKHHEGLIILSGCPSGEVPKLLAQGRMDDAAASANWYRELFGDRYFLELMEHGGVPDLPVINKGLIELQSQLNIPVVATNDSHYINERDAPLQDILICIHTNTNIQDESRLKMEESSYYLKSHEEMVALYPEMPEAISNTERVAEMCNLEMDFSQLRLPEYNVPDGMTAGEYLAQLCWEGLRRRIERVSPQDEERLTYELEVIKQTQFDNYFLVVWDIAKFVRERDIFFAVRGSAAASLVLFCLGVTNINPLPYRLVFERFLNVERKEMPDIDMDFQDDRREEVINYVVSRYGREHVAQIITFGTLGARASIRDVGRALAMPYADVDRIAKLVPFKLHITLDEAMELNPEFREAYDADDSIKRLIDTGRKLEGLTRHSSTHAAGVVISKEPLDDVVPLQRPTRGDEDGVSMTQYAMEPLAALGLLKMDFLGLVNLSVLARARNLIMATQGVEIVLQDIPLDDEKTFDLLTRGDTVGVFQMEGSGMTRYIKELKPNSLADVAAMIALYRPGPMEHITAFIEAKHGITEVRYPHPALKDLLEETYGIIVYQDQVLQIFRTFAGYSLGEADIVRKAMGKKIAAIMAEEREKFIQGALKNGYAQELAEELFALITPFAGYAFNKAHSVSYGLISYWTAYLKANYPVEYMVSLLNSYIDTTDRIATAVTECRRMMIQVLPPDITRGEEEFTIEALNDGQQAIRFGMAAVKNVGAAALRPVIEARKKEGPFVSIEQMCRSADMSGVNRKTLESLIKVGAFDMFGERSGLISVIDRIITLAQSEARLKDSDQTSMFDLFGESVPTPLSNLDIPDIRTPEGEKWAWEKELLGVPLSNNSLLSSIVNDADPDTVVFLNQIDTEMGGKKMKLRGQVASVIQRYTRENKPFTIATLGLMDGTIEVFVWENVLEETQGLWEDGKLVTITGTVRVREDQISISCSNASEYKVPDAADATASAGGEGYALSEAGYSNGASQAPASNGMVQPPNNVSSIADKRASNGYGERAAEQTNTKTLQRLSLRIRETDTPTKDNYLLEDVKRLLLEYRGEDEVSLQIVSDGRIITLEWPLVRVNACPQLEGQLREILGDAGQVSVESIAR